MQKATYIVDRNYEIGEIDRRLFGSFAEHLGRTVYNGIYEPDNPEADEQGFRKDVIGAVKEAGISLVRYPGGNFVSAYDWKNGIGPVAQRPKMLDPAWQALETNRIGTDEFADWCRKADVELMEAVNLGTGTPESAAQLVEYCNHAAGSRWSDLRIQNGHPSPYGVKLWCLGNEMDGEWQIGALSPEDYGKKALEAAKYMKQIDPSIELVACGSCCCETPTYPDWNRIVLEHVYNSVDYLSLHRYYSYDALHQLFYKSNDNISDVAAFAVDLQEYIHTVLSAADFVQAKKHSKKKINISFDEWNVISNSNPPANNKDLWLGSVEDGQEIFNVLDAVICSSILCTFLKNADRVKVACQSLLVNCGGMFYTAKGGSLVKNTTYYPFSEMAAFAKGVSLQDRVSCRPLKTEHHGEVPSIQSACAWNPEKGELSVFLANFDTDSVLLDLELNSFGKLEPIEHVVLSDRDITAVNTFEEPDRVVPHRLPLAKPDHGKLSVELPPISWNMLRFSCNSLIDHIK